MVMIQHAASFRIGYSPVKIGVGMSAGKIFCGNLGGDLKRQFTVFGHSVNLAARCESACKELNAPLVLSEDFCLQLPEGARSRLIRRPDIEVKGVGSITLYSLVSFC